MSEIERSEGAMLRAIGYALAVSVGLSLAIVVLVVAIGLTGGPR